MALTDLFRLLNKTPFQIRLKRVTSSNVNGDTVKALAVEAEPHWTIDSKTVYVFDGTNMVPVGGGKVNDTIIHPFLMMGG